MWLKVGKVARVEQWVLGFARLLLWQLELFGAFMVQQHLEMVLFCWLSRVGQPCQSIWLSWQVPCVSMAQLSTIAKLMSCLQLQGLSSQLLKALPVIALQQLRSLLQGPVFVLRGSSIYQSIS